MSFPTWTTEALGGNSPLMWLNFELPVGFVLVAVTKSAGPGSLPNMVVLLQDDLGVGPIDITLAAGRIVEGKITSGITGAPLVDIGVMALRPNSMLIYGGQGDAFEVEATASTDATGKYRLTVRSGTYVLYAPGPRDNTQRRFWSDDPAVFQATSLKVERSVAGIDIALVPTTQLWGLVRPGSSLEGEAGTRVAAYLGGGTACCRLVGLATTGFGGTFVMYVPQGHYRIVFDPPAGSSYAAQWWNRAPGFATATDVTVGSELVRLEVELVRVRP